MIYTLTCYLILLIFVSQIEKMENLLQRSVAFTETLLFVMRLSSVETPNIPNAYHINKTGK